MISLKKANNELSDSKIQLRHLNSINLIPFIDKLKALDLFPLTVKSIDTFQINLGKMCNQVCDHCHVDAGPDRKEVMNKETMVQILDAIRKSTVKTVDLTGGAPEMNPNFRWFVEEIHKLGKKIIVRCNLTIIVANKKHFDLPEFFKKHEVEVVSSLPCYTEENTDKQRGKGVFEKSLQALKMLNEVGYGKENSGLILNFVYNPGGVSLPPPQKALEVDYKIRMKEDFNIEFNDLYTITNIPISRYLNFLISSGNYELYMQKLLTAYNPKAVENVMCRSLISIGWDGFIYDCDFNQMLDLKVYAKDSSHISEFNFEKLLNRFIIVNQHCYGCTAGAGSSCGGEIL